MTSSFESTNKSIKCCNCYLKIQCKGWGRFDQISLFQARNSPKNYNTFFTVLLSFSMSSFPPSIYSSSLSVSANYFLLFLMFLNEYSHYSGYISSPTVFPPLSVSLSFFSVSLLSLSALSLLTTYSFPNLDQSLDRNQMDI